MLENHQGSGECASHSGWPQVPSEVPAVLLPFFREDIHQFPLQSTSGFPSRENPETHGAPASQDSFPQEGSQGRARSAVESTRIASHVIKLGIIVHVGPNKRRLLRMLGIHTAHAWSKRKKQKGESNHGLRIWRQRFRQLAHGLVLKISGQSKPFTSHYPLDFRHVLGSHFHNYFCGWFCFSCGTAFCALKNKTKQYNNKH